MKKSTIKVLVLAGVFLISIIVFSLLTNKSNTDITTTMSEASLPIIHFYNGETKIEELHGYVTEMDNLSMRDSIIPINNDRVLKLEVSTYGVGIDGINYQIRSIDGQRLVAEDKLSDYKVVNNKIEISLDIPNALENDQEYMFNFVLASGDRTINYYARIMQTVNCDVESCLAFAKEFHEKTFQEGTAKFYPTYMDPATGDATTLSYVDLSCTIGQIRWADFKGQPVSDAVISFKEINDSYNVITIQTVVSNVNSNGETEYYNVEEYFRLRDSDTRMYVLNYERYVNQIFSGANNFVAENQNLLLGIRNSDVEYMASESATMVCFVQEGDLWSFNKSTSEISKVFSFRGLEGIDARENWDQHDIKIVRIDEAGSIDFIVYGYMSRGDHEGQVGTAVYHYDGLGHTIEEEAFIPSNTSYEVLKAELGRLMYQNDKGTLYFMLEGQVYTIDMDTLEVSVMISGLSEGCYAVSENNKYFAWVETAEQYSSQVVYLMNLQEEKVHEIKAEDGKFLKPLGFINQDFIYGIATSGDVKEDAAGNYTFAMRSLNIVNTSENSLDIIKEYTPPKGFIKDLDVEDYTVTVNLVKSAGNQYVDAGTDSIMNHDADIEGSVLIDTVYTDDKQTQVVLTIKAKEGVSKFKQLSSKPVKVENDRVVNIDMGGSQERFYVYVKGDVLLATDSISEAISYANSKLGVVIDSRQQYEWQRARRTYVQAFSNIKPNEADNSGNSIVKCLSAMLQRKGIEISVKELVTSGYSAKKVLEQSLENVIVLDVSGCSSEDILFYVSNGNPVLAMVGNDSAVLVIGYSTTNIYYYDPSNGETKSITFEEADEMFLRGGRHFITYTDMM